MTVAGRYEYLKQSTLKPEAFDDNSKEFYCSDVDKEELPEPAEYAADINPIDILTAGD